MKLSLLLAAGLPLVAPLSLSAAVKSGHAEADLVAGVSSYQPGKSFPVAVRLTVDPGWHTYWFNPGMGGMPVKATWTLPDGWTAGELQQPVPIRFMTGDLPGFGYEGEAVFLVDLTPPADATGDAECKVQLAWLTCDESACVPGAAELSVKLPAGDGAAGKDRAGIEAARTKIPVPLAGIELRVEEKEGMVHLFLNGPAGFEPAGCSVFPATPDVIDPAANPSFVKSEGAWAAVGKKSEYAGGPATQLDIVLSGGEPDQPVVVSWRAKK